MASVTLQDLLREIRDMKGTVHKLEIIIEGRLIGMVAPTPEERRAVRAYGAAKRWGKLRLASLEEVRNKLVLSSDELDPDPQGLDGYGLGDFSPPLHLTNKIEGRADLEFSSWLNCTHF